MENHEQKISGGREGFWLNRPNKILTEGRPAIRPYHLGEEGEG